VINRLLGLLEDSNAQLEVLKARLHDETEKHKVEAARWLGLFNDQAQQQHHKDDLAADSSIHQRRRQGSIAAVRRQHRHNRSRARRTAFVIWHTNGDCCSSIGWIGCDNVGVVETFAAFLIDQQKEQKNQNRS
jgi:hypothetical protein